MNGAKTGGAKTPGGAATTAGIALITAPAVTYWPALTDDPDAAPDGAAIAFTSRTVRFVPAGGVRTGIVAVDLHATDHENGPGLKGELCDTLIRFV